MKKRTNNIISPSNWITWFGLSLIFGFIGGFLIVNAYHFYRINYFCLVVGYASIIAAVICDIYSLASLITEAHVQALEIFYGKERAIKPKQNLEQESI